MAAMNEFTDGLPDSLRQVLDYHEATKHRFEGFAPGPGFLDWATQPDPFRRYAGARLISLQPIAPADAPGYDAVFTPASIANAIRFTPPGGCVSIRLGYQPPGPLRLEISDTGDGMTEAELARARAGLVAPEPFRRRSGGTGIGLPLVRALALALGATLAFDSRPREGTRVTIDFPPDRLVPV